MTNPPSGPTDSKELEHTKITDEILKVIDQQPLNRYAVALRLTRWYEAQTQKAIEAFAEKLEKQRVTITIPGSSTYIKGNEFVSVATIKALAKEMQ